MAQVSNSLFDSTEYKKLVRDLKKIFTDLNKTGTQSLNAERLNSYWTIGQRLIALQENTDLYLNHLAKNIKVQPLLLYRTRTFYLDHKTGLNDQDLRLNWTEHLELAPIRDKKLRNFYLTQAIQRGWGKTEIRHAIKNKLHEHEAPQTFSLSRTEQQYHLYKAKVLNVIDGDTLDIQIDLGFSTKRDERLRLRGINTSELDKTNRPSANAERADKARAYVQDKLKDIPFVAVKTYKSDIYGRFIADVFYHPALTDKEDVARDGFFLNDELLREGLADPWGI